MLQVKVEAVTEKVFLKTCFERSYGYKWLNTHKKGGGAANQEKKLESAKSER